MVQERYICIHELVVNIIRVLLHSCKPKEHYHEEGSMDENQMLPKLVSFQKRFKCKDKDLIPMRNRIDL